MYAHAILFAKYISHWIILTLAAFRARIHGQCVLQLFMLLLFLISLYLVPLATLICATKPPSSPGNAILSPEGRKRYFVVHGGLFSKDDITLEDIRKVERIGRQPGQEGLMCESIYHTFGYCLSC